MEGRMEGRGEGGRVGECQYVEGGSKGSGRAVHVGGGWWEYVRPV